MQSRTDSLLGILKAMSQTRSETHRRILNSAYGLFYADGFQRVTTDAIAAAAGVTKRTLYNHFSSKDALIAAVVAHHSAMAHALVAKWCGSDPLPAPDLIRNVFAGLRAWAARPGWRGSGFTRAAMELAWAHGHPARHAAAAHKTIVEQELANAFERSGRQDSEKLAAEIMVLIEGATALRLIHGDGNWFDVAETAGLALLTPAPVSDLSL